MDFEESTDSEIDVWENNLLKNGMINKKQSKPTQIQRANEINGFDDAINFLELKSSDCDKKINALREEIKQVCSINNSLLTN